MGLLLACSTHTHAIGDISYGKLIVLEISVSELDLTPSPPIKKEKRGLSSKKLSLHI